MHQAAPLTSRQWGAEVSLLPGAHWFGQGFSCTTSCVQAACDAHMQSLSAQAVRRGLPDYVGAHLRVVTLLTGRPAW